MLTRDWLFYVLWWMNVGFTFLALILGSVAWNRGRQIKKLKQTIKWLQRRKAA